MVNGHNSDVLKLPLTSAFVSATTNHDQALLLLLSLVLTEVSVAFSGTAVESSASSDWGEGNTETLIERLCPHCIAQLFTLWHVSLLLQKKLK